VSERRQDESLDALGGLASAPGPLVPSDFCTVPSDYSLHVTHLLKIDTADLYAQYLPTYPTALAPSIANPISKPMAKK